MNTMFSFVDGVPVVTFDGGEVTNPLLLPDGTAAAPSLSFVNNPTSGLFNDAGQLKYSASTTLRVTLFSGGVLLNEDSGAYYWGATQDLGLHRDAADILAQRRLANAQTFRVYNTWTDASNGEWFSIDWATTLNVVRLSTQENGGATVRDIALMGGNVGIGRTDINGTLDIDGGESTTLLLNFDDTVDGFGELEFSDKTSGNLKWSIGVAADSASPTNGVYFYQYRDNAEAAIDLIRLSISNDGFVGIGIDIAKSRLHLSGAKSLLIMEEVAAVPVVGDLSQDAAVAILRKADKLSFAYNLAGVMNYLTFTLDGSTTTFTNSTTAP